MTARERAEMDELRAERDRLQALTDELKDSNARLESELASLRTNEAELIEERTRNTLTIKAKETQLVRARSDADVAKETVAKQQREMERLKRELARSVRSAATSPPPGMAGLMTGANGEGAAGIYADAGLRDVDRYERDRASKEVGYQRARSYMSSPSEEKENANLGDGLGAKGVERRASPAGRFGSEVGSGGSGSPLRSSVDGAMYGGEPRGDGVDSWKRAAEVTSALKARIEQMKVSFPQPTLFDELR